MKAAEEIIRYAVDRFGSGLALSTSFQKGGIVVLDMAIQIAPSLRVLTIDTGRLPEETYAMIENIRSRYDLRVEMIYPDAGETAEMVSRYGPNLFYLDQPSRMLCCQIRKVRPLERKVDGISALLTGLRREQSETREKIDQIDESGGYVKINPLAYWSSEDVDRYTALHELPVHSLYARGYTSIGCGPCTRATSPGEDLRAGRWWWETSSSKECGIHMTADGVVRRTVDVMLHDIEQSR
jgi:phosphoadenylyl-sulfate reductase (thioredoxin)